MPWKRSWERSKSMKKTDLIKLKAAQSNAIKNAMMLLDGVIDYPRHDDINKANALIDTAVKIEAILRGNSHE